MFSHYYRQQFHFNALHNITPDQASRMHAHTFRVVLYAASGEAAPMEINDCEKAVRSYLTLLEGKKLNELPPFRGLIPTIENICSVLFRDLTGITEQHHLKLIKLETGDSPLSSFSIASRLLLGSNYIPVSDSSYRLYREALEARYGL